MNKFELVNTSDEVLETSASLEKLIKKVCELHVETNSEKLYIDTQDNESVMVFTRMSTGYKIDYTNDDTVQKLLADDLLRATDATQLSAEKLSQVEEALRAA